MALKLYVRYTTADNEIVHAQFYDDATPPTPDVGEAFVVLDGTPPSGFPAAATHKINPGPPATVVDKTPAEQQAYKDALRKTELERIIGHLDATREAMFARIYDVTSIDADIAAAIAEHATLP